MSQLPKQAINQPIEALSNYENLKPLADLIRSDIQTIGENIISIGSKLLYAKRCIAHGDFGRWLENEFGWTDRTARRYMLAAEVFEDKSDIVSVLPATTLYKLSSPKVPTEKRDAIVGRLEAGEKLSVKEIHAALEPEPKSYAEINADRRRRRLLKRGKKITPQEEARLQQRIAKENEEVEQRDQEARARAKEGLAILDALLPKARKRLIELIDDGYVVRLMVASRLEGED